MKLNRMIISTFYTFLLFFLVSCEEKTDNTINTPEEQEVTATLVVDDLTIPWGMTWLPDGSMLILEKAGQIYRIQDGNRSEISNVPVVYNRGQGGLMDIELHPDYANNGWLYLSFASEDGDDKGGNTQIVRAKLEGNALAQIETLYKATPNTTKGQHFGSRLEFDRDGYLYFTVGDRGNRDVNPQDITRDNGKVYRIQDDGRIPEDNPFVGQANAKEAIFTYGNRNPQGMAIHPDTGKIWIHEHGPRGGDEINVVEKGTNYGWPVITYGINYSGTPITDITHKEGMAQPMHYWDPSIAPSGMAFISSDNYPSWKGDLLVGSLSFQYLEKLELDGESVVSRDKLLDGIGRVRNVRQGPDGFIYVAVEGKGIYRLDPQ